MGGVGLTSKSTSKKREHYYDRIGTSWHVTAIVPDSDVDQQAGIKVPTFGTPTSRDSIIDSFQAIQYTCRLIERPSCGYVRYVFYKYQTHAFGGSTKVSPRFHPRGKRQLGNR